MNFWCVNCGKSGQKDRKVILCVYCDYAGVTELDDEEYEALCRQQGKSLPGVENWKAHREKNHNREMVVVVPEDPPQDPPVLEIKGVMG